MKPYGLRSKFLYNYKDAHPKKGYCNWWEIELGTIKSNKTDRMKVKRMIKNILKRK